MARPTDNLEEIVRFYREGLGLLELCSFKGHDGYEGVMLGLPGRTYHLEFTRHENGSPCPAPTKDNLLVLYLAVQEAVDRVVQSLAGLGYESVAPENRYWEGKSVIVEDPDGWRVVLFDGEGI